MFQDSLTKKIAEAAAKIKTEPEVINVNEKSVEGAVEKIMNEKLIGNQHQIDANKNNKIDAHDFKLLRAKKKMKEETELTESHFKVGDEVVCKKSGMEGEVVKVDEPQVGKYYTVKQENGKMMKYAPDELKKEEEDEDEDEEDKKEMKESAGASKSKEEKFHMNLDKLVHKTFGHSPAEKKEKMKKESIDEAMWPGTPEYKAKYGTDKEKHEAKYGKGGEKIEKYGYRGKEAEHGETDWSKETKKEPKKKYGARQNYVRSRKISGKQLKDSFTGLLDIYREGGLKSIKEMFIKEEPTQDEYKKEVEQVKAKDRGENRNDKNIAAGKVDAVKIVDEDTGQADARKTTPSSKEAQQKVFDKHKERMKQLAKEDVEQIDEVMTRKHFQQVADVIKSHPDQEKRNELAKHHAGIFKASNPRFDHNRFYQAAGANIKEDVEQIDELNKSTLASYAKKATHSARIKQKIAKDFEAGAQRARKPDMKAAGEELSKKYQRKAQKREEGVGKAIDRLAKEEVEQVDEVLDSAGKFMSYATKAAASGLKSAVMGTGKYRKRQAGIQKAVEKAKAKVNEELEEIHERSLTEPEMKKKEEIVKSMKKNMKGFKERYGERGKSVAYATATKIAKEKA